MNEFLLKIRLLRTALKIPQSKIAFELGIEQCTYSRMERGESPMHIEHLFKIAALFCINHSDLLSLSFDQLMREHIQKGGR